MRGGDFRTGNRFAPEIFEALDYIPLKMISYGASQISISLLIDSIHKQDALRSLHKHLFSGKK
jgi:aspartate kinase